MNYVDEIASELGARFPGKPMELLRLYALLVLTTGEATTLENVHDTWAVWRAPTHPDNPSLVPFGALSPEVRERDRKYVDAIREVAAVKAAANRSEDTGTCPALACSHLWSLHGPDGCTGKVFPAHSLTGEPCPCKRGARL